MNPFNNIKLNASLKSSLFKHVSLVLIILIASLSSIPLSSAAHYPISLDSPGNDTTGNIYTFDTT